MKLDQTMGAFVVSALLVACANGGGSAVGDSDPEEGAGGNVATTSSSSSSSSSTSSSGQGGAGEGPGSGGGDGGSGGEVGTGGAGNPVVGTGFAYIGASAGDDMRVADLATLSLVAPSVSLLPSGNYPYDATMTPDASEVWTVGAVGDGVVVLDTATNTVTQNIVLGSVGEYPVDVVFSADGGEAYVSSRDTEAIVIIDTATYSVSDTIALPAGIDGGKMALDPCTGNIYAVDWYAQALMEIDPVQGTVSQTNIGTSLWDLVIDASGSTLYVADRGTDQVHVIDVATMAVLDSVAVGDDPWGIDLSPDGALVVVASEDSGSLTFIDTATHTPTSLPLPSGAKPRDVDISDDGLLAYVPSGDMSNSDGLFVIDLTARALANTILLGIDANPNVVTVAPPQVNCVP